MRSTSHWSAHGPRLGLRCRCCHAWNRGVRAAATQFCRGLADEPIRKAATSAGWPHRGPASASKAGFISTITPCGLQRATAMGACSNMARKVVLGFLPLGRSGHGNGVAVFILILCRGTIPGRNPTMGYPIPWCSRNGSDQPPWRSSFRFRSHYRRANLTLRRADVTQKREKACGKLGKDFIFSAYGGD